MNEIPDNETLLIPIKVNKSGKIRSIQFVRMQEEDDITTDEESVEDGYENAPFNIDKEKHDKLSLQNAELELLNNKDSKEFIDKICLSSGIKLNWTNSHRLCRISNINNNEMLILKDYLRNIATKKIILRDDITVERVRLKRIIRGINAVQHGDVENKKLVNAICTNSIDDFNNSYTYNEQNIEDLKESCENIKDNIEQLQTIDKILSMEENNVDILLVQGPPGTGKTELIIELAKQLLNRNCTTLITSNVQVACDNISERMRNDKEVIFKRYKDIKSTEEKAKNQLTYLKNQVLSKYMVDDKVITNEEMLNELKLELHEIKEKLNELKINKQNLDKKYSDYSDIINQISKEENKIATQNETLAQLKNTREKFAFSLRDILNQYKTASFAKKEVENELKKYSQNINELNTSNNNLKLKLVDVDKLENKNQIDLENYKKQINILNQEINDLENINIDYISGLIEKCIRFKSYIRESQELSVIKNINNIIEIVNILKWDYNFWNYGDGLSRGTINKLNRNRELFTQETKEFIDQIPIATQYVNMSIFNKIYLFFSHQLDGVSKNEYKTAKSELQRVCSKYKCNYADIINQISDNFFKNINQEIQTKKDGIISIQNNISIINKKRKIMII